MNLFDYLLEENKLSNKYFVLNEKDKITYKDLYTNALRIASYLNDAIGDDKNIILISENSVFFISVYLGIIKSGNVCIPLNFNIEQNNFDHIKSLTDCNIVFASKAVTRKLNLNKIDTVYDENSYLNIFKNSREFKSNKKFDENRLAEIIFTSGSTGKPKGVMISHKNIIANTNSIITYLKLKLNDIACVVLPFYYCYGLSLLHSHLKIGGSIVLNNTFMFLGTVIKDLNTYKCTGFAGVPSHFQMLLKKSDSFKVTLFPNLRYVTQAGGKLPNSFIKEFVEIFPDKQFYVMYGQTEATARLSYLKPEQIISKLGSIGKAIPGVELKIIDKSGHEVKVGEEGELIAKGDNIMQGYFRDLLLTNTILKNNWLYTGDIAKKDKDGYIFLVAREKEIIKVGGNRVSPKEIEEIITTIPTVVDCTIKKINDDIQGEAIKAIVVINNINEKDFVKKEILEVCKQRLAMFKVPRFFEFTDKLNVKVTGKK